MVGDGSQDGGAGEDGGQVEPAVAAGGARGRVADRDQPGGVVGRPGPGAPPGAEQLEVGHHEEGADVEGAGPAPDQEAEQAQVPERTERVRAGRPEQPPPGVQATEQDGGRHRRAGTPVQPGRPADRQGAQVDQAVTRRDERRHVAQPVHVHLEQRRERVLDRGGEDHDDRHLGPDERGLPAQQGHEEQPGPDAQSPLPPDAGAAVEQEHQGHPQQGDHDRRVQPAQHAQPADPVRPHHGRDRRVRSRRDRLAGHRPEDRPGAVLDGPRGDGQDGGTALPRRS